MWIRFASSWQSEEQPRYPEHLIINADSGSFRFTMPGRWEIEVQRENDILKGRVYYEYLPMPRVIIEAIGHGSCRTDLNGSFELQIKKKEPSDIYLIITVPEPICEALKEFLSSEDYKRFQSEICRLWLEEPIAMFHLISLEEHGELPPEDERLRELYERKRELIKQVKERWIKHVENYKPKEDFITTWLRMMAVALAHMIERKEL